MLWMQVEARPTITPSYAVHVSKPAGAITASAGEGEEATHSNAGARRELHHGIGRGGGVRGAVGGCYRRRRGMLLYDKCMGDRGVRALRRSGCVTDGRNGPRDWRIRSVMMSYGGVGPSS
jgi:hypothetical protein